MSVNTKLDKESKAAKRIAEMMYESLRKLPEDERKTRVKAIQKIKISRRSSPKRTSTQASLRESLPHAAIRHKRADR